MACRDCLQEIEEGSRSRGRLPQPKCPSWGPLCRSARRGVCCRWPYARAAPCINTYSVPQGNRPAPHWPVSTSSRACEGGVCYNLARRPSLTQGDSRWPMRLPPTTHSSCSLSLRCSSAALGCPTAEAHQHALQGFLDDLTHWISPADLPTLLEQPSTLFDHLAFTPVTTTTRMSRWRCPRAGRSCSALGCASGGSTR